MLFDKLICHFVLFWYKQHHEMLQKIRFAKW